MKIDSVDFNADACKLLTEEEFVKTHFSTVRTDLDVDTREKWLRMAYGKVSGKKKAAVKAEAGN
jgi:hypothetical protein